MKPVRPRPDVPPGYRPGPYDRLPDVRDGLTRIERLVLYTMHRAKAEFGDRPVPTALLYGRVVEHVDLSPTAFQAILTKLTGHGSQTQITESR